MWYQLKIDKVKKADVEPIETLLYEHQALSTTIETDGGEEIFEPELDTTPLWEEAKLTALFDDESVMEEAKTYLTHEFPSLAISDETLEDRAWEREWLKDFKPMCYGKRLWVCPTHESPPEPDAITIMLDPGLAFGSGTHETTTLCLEWLDSANLSEKNVIDYGTGSGILAIASLKLGASHAYATDIDPQAIIATVNNAKTNAIDLTALDTFVVGEGELAAADIVLANILSNTLVELTATLTDLVKPKGYLVLSGILQSQHESVLNAYQDNFDVVEIKQKNDWVLVALKRQ